MTTCGVTGHGRNRASDPDFDERAVRGHVQPVACCLCGSRDSTPFWSGYNQVNRDRRWHVTQCRRCGLVFMNPSPHGFEDDLRERPFLRGFAGDGRPSLAANAFLAEWEACVLKRMPRGVLLDVGFGGGDFWRAASEAGWDAYGVDIHVSGVAAARAYWKTAKLVAGRIEEVPSLFPRPFDVINLSETLEHVAEPIDALRRLAGVLRPGGLLTIDVPNVQSAMGWVNRDRVMDVPAHLHYWSGATLCRALELGGLRVVSVDSGAGLSRALSRLIGPTAAGKTAARLRRIGRWGGGVHAMAEKVGSPGSNTANRDVGHG